MPSPILFCPELGSLVAFDQIEFCLMMGIEEQS